jgi:23S rRNA-/tRNA-specific pseudouridylate synthase
LGQAVLEKGFSCSTCHKRIEKEADAKNHHRDKHRDLDSSAAIRVPIVMEDEHFAIVVKPQGMAVMGEKVIFF